jgi:hypothetical protein
MNAFNNWALEHVEDGAQITIDGASGVVTLVPESAEEGATDLEEIVQYCLANMAMVDIPYVEEYLEENWDGYVLMTS